MSAPELLAQTGDIAASSPVAYVIGVLGTGFTGLLSWLLKDIAKQFNSMTREIRENTKEVRNVCHRFKSLETAILLDVQTRPTTPPFIANQIEKKLERRERGEDTKDEPS